MSVRNSLCPCGSGRKVKTCCGRLKDKVELILPKYSNDGGVPLGRNFTLEFHTCFDFEPSSFITLVAGGTSPQAINYIRPVQFDPQQHLFRLGLCNNEIRPNFRIALNDGTEQEVFSREAIKARASTPRHVAVVVNESKITLLIDMKPVESVALRGPTMIERSRSVFAGVGPDYPIAFARVWRSARSIDELHQFAK